MHKNSPRADLKEAHPQQLPQLQHQPHTTNLPPPLSSAHHHECISSEIWLKLQAEAELNLVLMVGALTFCDTFRKLVERVHLGDN